ncbi:MAG TPA: arylsulfatase [Gemmatimonadaceae bacterium]
MSRSRTSWVAAIAATAVLFGGTLAAFRPVRVGVRAFLTGEPGSPSATTTIDGHYLPAPPQKFGGQIGLSAKDSKPYWPARIVPPKGAPNVLLIMTDDAGYGVSGTFGGVIPTPALDRIAKMGLRYTQFHSTALCSPTRAALITGRNHHSVGYGVVSEQATGYPGYDSVIGLDNATVGEILKDNGYSTSWFGKDHNIPSYHYSQAGPFDQWPSGMGFEYFFGFIGGETDQWEPYLYRNTTPIYPWLTKPGYNLVTGMADDAIDHMRQVNATAPDKPFFIYYVPGATHAPHQPTKEWSDKFKGKFDLGWNAVRDSIYANQKRLGVIPADTKLTPWPSDLPRWETLTPEQKKLYSRQAEVFAGFVAYTDHEIGRVIQEVEDEGKLDNTLIIYIEGDNGTSAEGSLDGTPNALAALQAVNIPVAQQMKSYDAWGSPMTYPHMSVAWAWAFDSPFKWTKQIASHFGGTRQGMAMAWPARIKDAGGIRTQFHHMIDIVPTILEATGIPAPTMVNGIAQKPIEGVSMAYTWDRDSSNVASRRSTQYFEMFGNRAIYHDGWIAATTPPAPPWSMGLSEMPEVVDGYKWELYHIAKDYSENDDLASTNPDKLREMQQLFMVEAAKYNVFPLDNSVVQRAVAPRPSGTAGRTVFTYNGELTDIPASDAPSILGRSYTITAEVEIPKNGAEGVLVTEGGRFGGYGLYLVKGKPVFTYNFLDMQRYRWEAPKALGPGRHVLDFDFSYDGGGPGKGGTGVLRVDGQSVANKHIEHTMPFLLTVDETFDVGADTRTPVDDKDYQIPFRFTGKLSKLTIALRPERAAAGDVARPPKH